jgi:ankyrin repeat protein
LDQSATTQEGYTPFHLACGSGNLEAVRLLLSHPEILFNHSTAKHETPFSVAISCGHLEVVKELALCKAVKIPSNALSFISSDLEMLELLLSDLDINLKFPTEHTVLTLACQSEDLALVRRLLKIPALDINSPAFEEGLPPIVYAARLRLVSIMKVLLEDSRLDLQILSNTESSPFIAFCAAGSLRSCTELLSFPKLVGHITPEVKVKEVLAAAKMGHLEVFKKFVSQVPSGVDCADSSGQSPLMEAVLGNQLALVTYLLQAGVNANMKNTRGLTALHLAVYESRTTLVKVLVESPNVVPDTVNEEGKAAFACACEMENNALVVKYFLDIEKVDLNLRDSQSFTAFHLACQKKNESVVRLLLHHPRVDVHLLTQEGPNALDLSSGALIEVLLAESDLVFTKKMTGASSPLFSVVQNRDAIGALKRLLSMGEVDVNTVDSEGKTPFYLACSIGNLPAVKVLLKDARVDINLSPPKGKHPLQLAIEKKRASVVRWILLSNKFDDKVAQSLAKTCLPSSGGVMLEILKNYRGKGNVLVPSAAPELSRELAESNNGVHHSSRRGNC